MHSACDCLRKLVSSISLAIIIYCSLLIVPVIGLGVGGGVLVGLTLSH